MAALLATRLDHAANVLLSPLDRVRAVALRHSGTVGRRLIADRALRVHVVAVVGIVTALLLTALAPLWTVVLGPLLLGVPHLLADVRYLVVRPGLHRDRRWWILCALPVAALAIARAPWVGGVAVLGGVAFARAGVVAWACGLALLGAVVLRPFATTWTLMHAHNLVALGLWWTWRADERRRLLPVALALAIYVAILLGALDPVLLGAGTMRSGPASVSPGRLFAEIAPGLSHPWDARVVASFVFAQAVHYGVWLRWIPEDDRPRTTPRPLLASYRAVRDDLHPVGLLAFAGLATGLLALAAADLRAARVSYFRLAAFHGWMELALVPRLLKLPRLPAPLALAGVR